MSHKTPCFVTTGSVDAGKSTMLGHFVQEANNISSILDTKDKQLRVIAAKHPHEVDTGKTSDRSQFTFKRGVNEIIIEDLAGHEKYLNKTTKRGLTGTFPDYGMLMIGGNKGVYPMTKEHYMLLKQLGIPVIVVITKEDLSTRDIFENIKKELSAEKTIKPIFINSLSKIELENEQKESSLLKDRLIKVSKELEKINPTTENEKMLKSILKELKLDDASISLYDGLVMLKQKYKKQLQNMVPTDDLIIRCIKSKKLLETVDQFFEDKNIQKTSNNIAFVNWYLASYGLEDKQFLPTRFIDECIRAHGFSNEDLCRVLIDREHYSEVTDAELNTLITALKTVCPKEKEKNALCKRVAGYLTERLNARIQIYGADRDILIQKIETMYTRIDIDEDRIRKGYYDYIKGDGDLENEDLSVEEVKIMTTVIADKLRNDEIKRLPDIVQIAHEFSINSSRFPVFVTSCKTGYYLESLKTFMMSLVKKERWNSDEETIFYIDTVFGFKGKDRTKVLPFDGFVVSGTLRGQNILVGDNVFIGPHQEKFISATVKSIHNNNKQHINFLQNTQKGALGLQITDPEYKKSFTYKDAFPRGMLVTHTKDFEKDICWSFTAELRINKTGSVTIKNGFRPVFHMNTINEPVVFCLPSGTTVKPGEKKGVTIRFTQRPQCIPLIDNTDHHTRFLISEGQTRGIGAILSITPIKDDPDAGPRESKSKERRRRNKPKKKGDTKML